MAQQPPTPSGRNFSALFGIILILLGVFMLSLPLVALGFTAFAVGLLLVLRSLSLLSLATGTMRGTSRSLLVTLTVVGFVVAAMVIVSPFFAVTTLGILVSVGLVVLGLGDLVRAFSPAVAGTNRWIALFVGLISFLVIGFISTATNAAGIAQPVAVYAVLVGLFDIMFGVAYGGGEFQRSIRQQRMARPG